MTYVWKFEEHLFSAPRHLWLYHALQHEFYTKRKENDNSAQQWELSVSSAEFRHSQVLNYHLWKLQPTNDIDFFSVACPPTILFLLTWETPHLQSLASAVGSLHSVYNSRVANTIKDIPDFFMPTVSRDGHDFFLSYFVGVFNVVLVVVIVSTDKQKNRLKNIWLQTR